MFGRADELSTVLRGWLRGRGSRVFNGVSTDSRTIAPGQIYVALKGDRFDGHDFISKAFEKGAAGVVAGMEWTGACPAGSFVVNTVDTRSSFGTMANYWRKQSGATVIGVTGSCGKTTTKEIIHAIAAEQGRALRNHANLNNYYGVSQTLLKLRGEKVAVVEMGINNPEEMKELVRIAAPDLGIATNIGPVHLEGLGSLKEVYAEKKLLLDGSRRAVFINADDRFLKGYRSPKKTVSFGKGGDYSWRKMAIEGFEKMYLFINERRSGAEKVLQFPYVSTAFAPNIAGAVAVGRYLGAGWEQISRAVASVRLPGLRMELVKEGGADIIMDAYNANPLSMKHALRTLAMLKGTRKAAVLGDMRELGRWSRYYHRLLANWIAAQGLCRILLVGPEMVETYAALNARGISNVRHAENVEGIRTEFEKLKRASDVILLKGSRSIGLEKLVRAAAHAI